MSYSPGMMLVGLDGFEPSTPALSRRCSNQLSYRPAYLASGRDIRCRTSGYVVHVCVATDRLWVQVAWRWGGSTCARHPCGHRIAATTPCFPRKEVIQPHLPIRLPCYDFTPVTKRTVVSGLLAVSLPTSGTSRSHGVTGGVYKTRERIHRDMLIHDY